MNEELTGNKPTGMTDFSTSWHSYPSSVAVGHRMAKDLLTVPVNIEEKVDGCVSINTPILMADLRYVRAVDLQVGDCLLGFDDTLNNPRLRKSYVTHAEPFQTATLCVNLVDGRAIPATRNHPWLIRQHTAHNGKAWITTENLQPGMRIVALPLWESEDRSEEKGYLAGAFDGEGSLVRSGNGRILSFYQRVGSMDDHVLFLLRQAGFEVRRDIRRRKKGWARVASTIIKGGWPEILRFLGDMRPVRLLADAEKVWLDAPLNGVGDVEVVSITTPSIITVMGLSTSTQTYVAGGLFSHNSQFSFGIFPNTDTPTVRVIDGVEYGLKVRSKGATMHPDAPMDMFKKGVDTVKALVERLHPGWTYRCELLAKPKHNALAYDRTPKGNIILFDVNSGHKTYLTYEEKKAEAERLGLEVVPLIYAGMVTSMDQFREFLETDSILGGQKIEGVVIKPIGYILFGADKKAIMGKFVSEAFKEVHAKNWKTLPDNVPGKDIVQLIAARYTSAARWQKAIHHLREAGLLDNSPKDIGPIMQEIPKDVEKECKEEIMEELFKWAWPNIRRQLAAGFPLYYKEKLLEQQFTQEPSEVEK